jgi:hypothetical protein
MIYAYIYYVNVIHKCPREKKWILNEVILVSPKVPAIPLRLQTHNMFGLNLRQ